MNRKDEILNIKEKSSFIFANSGLICSKLDDPKSYEETLNNLQVFLLCDLSLDQLGEICFFLSNKNNTNIIYTNNYNNAIKIIFVICKFVNDSNYSDEGKISLRNKLREYNKYFNYTNKDLKKTHKFVKIKI